MTEDLGAPMGHREIIRRIEQQKAAEAATKSRNQQHHQQSQPKDPGPQRAQISAFRNDQNHQYYAMSREDRTAYQQHCNGIISCLNPANHHERWLATSIAEDMWRLNRARALESNIFALSMVNPAINIDIDSPEGYAAICQARAWLADGKKLQGLTLYESRIRRNIEKNEKQLKELQAERKAERAKALEEAKLLARLALSEGEIYIQEENGFGFSSEEIVRLVHRDKRLAKAEALRHATKHRKAA